jgi:hypothetical protein
MLTFEGVQVQGPAAIVEKLTKLPFQRVQHQPSTVDFQPSFNNGMIIMVGGHLKVDDESHLLTFSQIFQLQPAEQPGNYWVLNDIFRLNY